MGLRSWNGGVGGGYKHQRELFRVEQLAKIWYKHEWMLCGPFLCLRACVHIFVGYMDAHVTVMPINHTRVFLLHKCLIIHINLLHAAYGYVVVSFVHVMNNPCFISTYKQILLHICRDILAILLKI